MQLIQDRPGRKSHLRRVPGSGLGSRLRIAGLLALTLALLAFVAAPAQAVTGGVSTVSAPPPATGTASSEGTTAPEGAELAFTPFRLASASWYGPGLYGRTTACGQVLRATTIGVAHKTLPCGTMVKFVYRGHAVVAPVIDRGPYVKGRAWDLTAAASKALGFESAGVGTVRYAVAIQYARAGASR